MSGKTSRAGQVLTAAEEEMLRGLARSRTAPVQEAEEDESSAGLCGETVEWK